MANGTLVHMSEQKRFIVVEWTDLTWPASLQLPSRRFRLFIAADSRDTSVGAVSEFVKAALKQGAVYCCVWGPGCERFHDIIDEVVVEDGLHERMFVGPTPSDVIMTTWHSEESLEEALDFFTTSAQPTKGFVADSE